MKRFITVFLVLMMLLSCISVAAAENGIKIKTGAHKLKFQATIEGETFVRAVLDTTYDHNEITLYSADGVFTTTLQLPGTFEKDKYTLTVYDLKGNELSTAKGKTAAADDGTAPAGTPADGTTSRVQNISLYADADGVHYSFTAPGRSNMILKVRSPQECHYIRVWADSSYHYEGVVAMECTFQDDTITVTGLTGMDGNELFKESFFNYYHFDAAPEKAASGRLTGVTVCIDPGHQRQTQIETVYTMPNNTSRTTTTTPGMAGGAATGRRENIYVLEVGIILRDLLLAEGADVVMTREIQETFVGMLERPGIANDANADFVLHLHTNANDNKDQQGIMIYSPLSSDYAKQVADEATYRQMAKILLNAMMTSTGVTNGGVALNNTYIGNNYAMMPSFLIEMGYFSCSEEDLRMNTTEYQTWLAQGMVEGIVELARFRGIID